MRRRSMSLVRIETASNGNRRSRAAVYEPIRARKLGKMTCGLGICIAAMALFGIIGLYS